MEFVAALVQALAWPLGAVVIALLFRAKILELLSPAMKRLKIGPFEAEFWDRTIAATEIELEQARVSAAQVETPNGRRSEVQSAIDLARSLLGAGHANAAVIEAFRAIEMSLHSLLMEADVGVTQLHVGGAGLAKLAAEKGLISEQAAVAVDGLARLRNLAARGRPETTLDRAADFTVLVEDLLYAIESPSK